MANKEITDDLAGRLFLYHRCGYDRRLIHLLADGQIGQGRANMERRWELHYGDGVPGLAIFGQGNQMTCDLRREEDGVWRGNWLVHEKMEIELIPQLAGVSGRDWRIEIGAGEHPHPDYHVHTDILPLPHVEYVGPMDRINFPDQTFTALRANDVLEHQSWELLPRTLREWARILTPGAEAFIQVPNGRYLVERWLKGELTIEQFNYWLLGGHASDRAAHRGYDEHGVPRWLWNAHHTIFTAEWLQELMEANGFTRVRMQTDGGSNLMCWAVRKGED